MTSDRALDALAHAVLWPGFAGAVAPDWLLRSIDAGTPGAVLFAHNVAPDGGARLGDLVARLGGPDSLLGIDEEGGSVTRLHARSGSPRPGHAALGRHDDVAATEAVAHGIGAELAGHGIGLDLAPVADVNNNPANPVIGTRSFGADPDLVARHTAAYVRGLQRAGTAACAKHFPGHGDTSTDSHRGVTRVDVPLRVLQDVHLEPFRAAIAAGVRAVLTAHIIVPDLGPEPATVNPHAVALLRDLGFGGMVVSDAMEMEAIAGTLGIGPGAVATLAAGVDLVCIGNQGGEPPSPTNPEPDRRAYAEVHRAVVAALTARTLRPERLEEAAERIAATRRWIVDARAAAPPPPEAAELDRVSRLVASTACDVRGDVRLRTGEPVTVIDARTMRNEAAGHEGDLVGAALAERAQVTRHRMGDAAVTALLASAGPTGELVLVLDRPHVVQTEREALAAVLARQPRTVVVRTGWPGHLDTTVDRMVTTFGSSAVSAGAVADLLLGG